MNMVVRILRFVLMVAGPSFVLLIAFSWLSYDYLVSLFGPEYFIRVASALIGALLISSGLLMLNEWRNNPLEETEQGEWSGDQLLYSIVFAITLIFSVYYLPALFFSL